MRQELRFDVKPYHSPQNWIYQLHYEIQFCVLAKYTISDKRTHADVTTFA
jgi:hypothetical protein